MVARTHRIREQKRRLRRFLIICTAFGMFFLFLFVGCRLINITVEGCSYYTEEQLETFLKSSPLDKNTLAFYLRKRYGEPVRIPFIQRMEIELVDFNTVHITVYEKDVIGCIDYMGEYLYFDKDGIMVGSSTEKQEGIPIVYGLSYRHIVWNEVIEVEEKEIFQTILTLTQLLYENEVSADSITFNRKKEITIQTGQIEILLGKRENYDEPIAQLKNLLPKAKGMKGTLDMREYEEGNIVIFKEKKTK